MSQLTEKKGERPAFTTKERVLSLWEKTDKNGNKYISASLFGCINLNLFPPYEEPEEEEKKTEIEQEEIVEETIESK